jgi:hypothetical protein
MTTTASGTPRLPLDKFDDSYSNIDFTDAYMYIRDILHGKFISIHYMGMSFM